jgi:hypothetical protein
MYFGTGDEVPAKLAAARVEARRRRLAANRAVSCEVCPRSPPTGATGVAA